MKKILTLITLFGFIVSAHSQDPITIGGGSIGGSSGAGLTTGQVANQIADSLNQYKPFNAFDSTFVYAMLDAKQATLVSGANLKTLNTLSLLGAGNISTTQTNITGNAGTVTGYTPAGGSLTLSGADAVTLTTTAATNVTLPTSGTLPTVSTVAAMIADSMNKVNTVPYHADYYVATWGSDVNDGSFYKPWVTGQKAADEVVAGDTIYIRGGVYNSDDDWINTNGLASGTAGNPICIFAYPGETPIIDMSSVPVGTFSAYGILIYQTDHWYVKGLEVRNMPELTSNGGIGIRSYYSDSCIIEQCVVHDMGCIGIQVVTGVGNQILNCDSYNNYDPDNNGNSSDGIAVNGPPYGSVTTVRGCRAWNNSDDGFDALLTDGKVILDNCWSFGNGLGSEGAGSGFKIGNTHLYADTLREITNCIFARNRGTALNQNLDSGLIVLYNNTIYDNAAGFGFGGSNPDLAHTAKNNIDYSNTSSTINAGSIHTNNTFDLPVTVSDADFVSLDTLELYRPRQADGSLPEIDFLKLEASSDLIDYGAIVGLPYNGLYPDVGAVESGITSVRASKQVAQGIPEPVAYWNLDETSGTTLNDYIGTNDLLITGGNATVNETGKIGKAVRFDGVNDSLSFTSTTSPTSGKSELTVAFWLKLNTVVSGDGIWAEERTASPWPAFMIRILTGWSTIDNTGSEEQLAWPAFTYTSWNRCVFVYSVKYGYKQIWVNGVKVAETTTSVGPLTSNRGYQRIGAEDGSSNDLDGWMDEISVWDKALTEYEILNDYNVGTGDAYPY